MSSPGLVVCNCHRENPIHACAHTDVGCGNHVAAGLGYKEEMDSCQEGTARREPSPPGEGGNMRIVTGSSSYSQCLGGDND